MGSSSNDEDWDNDEYVPQPVKYENNESKTSNNVETRVRGRGGSRGGRGSWGGGDKSQNTGGGNEYKGRDAERKSSEGSSRGRGFRGRGGGRGDYHRNNDNDGHSRGRGSDNDGHSRGRGRGTNIRGGYRREEHSNSTMNGIKNGDKRNSRDEGNGGTKEERRPRGMTPPRGARGRTRSTSGRISDSVSTTTEKNEDYFRFRGRGRGRGQSRNITSRSDGEDSDTSDGSENKNRRGRGRGRGGLERSRSFRGGTGSRGGRGRGGGAGRGGATRNAEEEKKPPEKYIPPEPTDDEEVMFHSGITCGIHFNKYDTIGIDVTGENPPKPISSFESAGLSSVLLKNINKSGYSKPTPVQKNAIPIITAGRDLMACAQTGSGKTAAFLIPVINDLLSWNGDLVTGQCIEPIAIVLSPTRELAIQIFQEARKFAHNSHLKIALVYGGTVAAHQLNQISRGCHILVAVPGRLENFVKSGHVKFSSIRYFILDEADRMLELGFKESVKRMLSHQSMTKLGQRRTLMFSATFPPEIQELAFKYLHNYLFLAVGLVGSACSDVQQHFYSVSKFDKMDRLLALLKENQKAEELSLVFVSMKRHADFLAVYLCENDLPTTSIHGDRYQSQREEALSDFKAGKRPILIATAVAARGLDIKNVAHVINYDLPRTIEEYVHRIGRTGRVGNCGKSTSFYDPNTDRPLAKDLLRILQQANQPVPDFLQAEAADSRYKASGIDEFSSTDIRTNNTNQSGSSVAAPQEEEEECWD